MPQMQRIESGKASFSRPVSNPALLRLKERMSDFHAFSRECVDRNIVKPKNLHHLSWLRMRVEKNYTFSKITDECLTRYPYKAVCLDGHIHLLEENDTRNIRERICLTPGCSEPMEIAIRDSLTPRMVCKAVNKLLREFGIQEEDSD